MHPHVYLIDRLALKSFCVLQVSLKTIAQEFSIRVIMRNTRRTLAGIDNSEHISSL